MPDEQTTTMTYDEAVERLVTTWTGETVIVTLMSPGGAFHASFAGRVSGVSSHDGRNAQVDTDGGTAVLSRDGFETAEWAEIPTGLRPITRTLTFSGGGRIVELQGSVTSEPVDNQHLAG